MVLELIAEYLTNYAAVKPGLRKPRWLQERKPLRAPECPV